MRYYSKRFVEAARGGGGGILMGALAATKSCNCFCIDCKSFEDIKQEQICPYKFSHRTLLTYENLTYTCTLLKLHQISNESCPKSHFSAKSNRLKAPVKVL